eukprot:2559119-Prymnesium_polylepis.1
MPAFDLRRCSAKAARYVSDMALFLSFFTLLCSIFSEYVRPLGLRISSRWMEACDTWKPRPTCRRAHVTLQDTQLSQARGRFPPIQHAEISAEDKRVALTVGKRLDRQCQK